MVEEASGRGEGQGLSRAERLRKRTDFQGVYSRGQRINTRHFVLFVLENQLPHHRLGLTVSRKIGKATARNQVKRRLREIFRTHKHLISTPSDLVINTKRSSAGASLAELRQSFLKAVTAKKLDNGEGRPYGSD